MRPTPTLFSILLALSLFAGCEHSPQVPPPETSNPPLTKHALIVSIDGCRPDVLLRAQLQAQSRGGHPAIAQLMAEGCFTFWARTIPESITLPSHTSMLTGVPADVHGITWNEAPPQGIIYPNVPTLFEVAKQHGLTTSIFAGKYKFFSLARPGSIDWGYITPPTLWVEDTVVAQEATDVIRKHKPNLIFVHLATTDLVGHAKYFYSPSEDQGWGSPEQLLAVERADEAVGLLVKALKDAGIYDDSLIIITADHGGAGTGHGPDDPRSLHIPWICVGPGVRRNYDLTRHAELNVKTEDTFATASYFLGLPISPSIQGRAVVEVLHDREWLQPQ